MMKNIVLFIFFIYICNTTAFHIFSYKNRNYHTLASSGERSSANSRRTSSSTLVNKPLVANTTDSTLYFLQNHFDLSSQQINSLPLLSNSLQRPINSTNIAVTAQILEQRYTFTPSQIKALLLKSPRIFLKGLSESNHQQLETLRKRLCQHSSDLFQLLRNYPYFLNTTAERTNEILNFYEDYLGFPLITLQKLIQRFTFLFFHKNVENLLIDCQFLNDKYGFTIPEIQKLILCNPYILLGNFLLLDYQNKKRIEFFCSVFALSYPPSLPYRKFILSNPKLLHISLEKIIEPNVKILQEYFSDDDDDDKNDDLVVREVEGDESSPKKRGRKSSNRSSSSRVRIMLYKLRSLLNHNPDILRNRILNRFFFFTNDFINFKQLDRQEFVDRQLEKRLSERNRKKMEISQFSLESEFSYMSDALEGELFEDDEGMNNNDSLISKSIDSVKIISSKADLIKEIVRKNEKALNLDVDSEATSSALYGRVCDVLYSYVHSFNFTTEEAKRFMQIHSTILTADIDMMKHHIACFSVSLGLTNHELQFLLKKCPSITTMAWNKKLFFLLNTLAEYADRYLLRRLDEFKNTGQSFVQDLLGDELVEAFEEVEEESLQMALRQHRSERIRQMLRSLFLKKPYLPNFPQTTLLERLEFFENYNLSWADLTTMLVKPKLGFNNYVMQNHYHEIFDIKEESEDIADVKKGNRFYNR